jgi:predicted O-methyltransferase YrrM
MFRLNEMVDPAAKLYYFIKMYFAALRRIIPNCSLSVLVSPGKAQRFFQAILESEDLGVPDAVLGSASIMELVAGDGHQARDIVIQGSYYDARSSDTRQLLELASIAYLVQASEPRRIFEIGTFVGRMTRLLAMNAPSESKICTLDLPQGSVNHTIGECFLESAESGRIEQLCGDSTSFDFSPYHDSIDFCWVDGSHEYEDVASDTAAAYRIVRDGGWIAWHDYRHTASWAGVTRLVREINSASGGSIRHILHTTTAVVRVSEETRREVLSVLACS